MYLEGDGPIDLCILGLGLNGHLGLNEPAKELQARCHVAALSPESLGHPMLGSLDSKPAYGLTLGIEDILDSRQIIMLVSGKDKKTIAKEFLKAGISNQLPASLLWKHGRTDCLVDSTVLG